MRNILATFAICISIPLAGLAQEANPPYKLKKNNPDPVKEESGAVEKSPSEQAAEPPAAASSSENADGGNAENVQAATIPDSPEASINEEEFEITLLPPAEEDAQKSAAEGENAESTQDPASQQDTEANTGGNNAPTAEENPADASASADENPEAKEDGGTEDASESDGEDDEYADEDEEDEDYEDAEGALTPDGKKTEESRPKVEISDEERLTNIEKSGIVAIMGTNGSATGFLATIQGKVFLVTNVHVIAGMDKPTIITMSGDEIKLGPVFTGRGHDIAISPIANAPENCKPLTFNEAPALAVHNNDKIVVCGNSEGRGTMLETYGTVIALGPKLVELDCPFYEGNSGSPVFHIPTRTVIGVTSHATIQDIEKSSPLSKASRLSDQSAIKSDTRYFGYRFDSVKNWERVNLNTLRKQNEVFDGYKQKLQIIRQHFSSDGKLTLDITIYKEFADIIGAYKKELSNLANPTARRRAEKNMYDKLARMCTNEASRLKALKTISAYDDMRETYQQEFERLALIFKNAHENKIF